MSVTTRQPTIALFSGSEFAGGAERSMFTLIRSYVGAARLVLVSPHQSLLDEAERFGLSVPLVAVPGDGSRTVTHSAACRVIRDVRPDLLHVNLPNPFADRVVIRAGYLLGLPVTTTEHLVIPSRRIRGRLLKRAYSSLLAAQIAVGRESARQLIEEYGLRSSGVYVVHNGLQDEQVDPVGFDRRPVVGCAARLEDQKQLDVLVRAMVHVPGARLVLVGDGSRRADLEALAEVSGVADRVEFTGWVPDARPHIAGFDVFALPSRNEAFPLTVLEAMLCETPVVATDVGSVTDAVHDGVTGLVVESGDVDGLARAIRRLLDDARLRADVVSAARSLAASEFTAAAMAARYDAIWADVLGRRRSRVFRGRSSRVLRPVPVSPAPQAPQTKQNGP